MTGSPLRWGTPTSTISSAVEGAPQAVLDDRVGQLGVAVAESAARAHRQVRGVRHALHAAGDHDVGLAGLDHLVGEVDRVQAREAHLVDVHGRDVHRDAGLRRGLAGRHLALAGHQHLAHYHVLNFFRLHPGALECGLDGETAEVGG